MGSGSTVTTGYEYFGGICQVICAGEIHRVTRIANGDTEIWSGDIDQTSRDSDGKTTVTTTIGTGHVYWGRNDQVANADLEAALVDFGTGPTTLDIPAWRHWALFIMPEAAFGNQPAPPTLTFDYERTLNLLTLSTHEISGDAVLPEVIYDVLTNALYSVGVDTSLVDSVSFAAACETIISEGIGASPQIDDVQSLRDFVGTLLQYIDGILYWESGKIKIRLVRKGDPATATPVDESCMTDEPEISGGSLADTWNFTRLVFTDSENNWDANAVEPYDDHANAALQGEHVPKDVELPFITRRAVAKILARRRGIAGGVPQMTMQLSLLPSFRTLKPGDLLSVTYAKLGLSGKLMRVMSRETDGSDNKHVRIEAVSEITRVEANDYVPPADPIFNLGAFFDSAGNVFGGLNPSVPRLLWIPDDLKGDRSDGMLVAFARPTDSTTWFKVWWTWDPAQKSYEQIDMDTEFPVAFALKGWMRCRNNTAWILRGEFSNADDADYIRTLILEGSDIYLVTARRLFKATGSTLDQHQVDGLWFQADANGRVTPVSGLVYDIEVTDQAFGSLGLSMETESGQGNYPCAVLYAGRQKDLYIRPLRDVKFERLVGNGSNFWSGGVLQNTDTELVRYIKVTTGNRQAHEDLEDVDATTYDRDDTTMCPEGTLSQSWGDAVRTLHEVYDFTAGGLAAGAILDDDLVEDIDIGLYAAVWGMTTVDQDLLIESTEQVLAYMVSTGAQYYNRTAI